VVQLPGVKEEDFASAKAKLAQTGQLHFQIVDDKETGTKFFEELTKREPTADNWPEGIRKDHKVVSGNGFARSTSRELLEHMAESLIDREHLIGFQEIFVNPSDPNLRSITALNKEQEQELRRQSVQPEYAIDEQEITRGYTLYFMFKKAGMGGENVTDARVNYDQFGKPEVNMTFAKVDADRFYEMTKKYQQKAMAIMIDEMVMSAPVIQGPIPGGNVRITLGGGRQVLKEASELTAVLKIGALQAPLTNEYDSQVGPSLGADSIQAGQTVIVWGLSLVIIFMLIYYRGAGLVADVALTLNVLFVLAGLTAFGATLTLPGIAGIVLTVGMAVDANVLIFERVREELRSGRTVRQSIDAGYDKAFSAILDANVTTGLAAIVLYQFGSGPIRGFAVTLGIGIICSMYTALVATRLIFDRVYGHGSEPKQMSI
jgi:preprotein translocase subunit SecD